jgi:hypothetical protein
MFHDSDSDIPPVQKPLPKVTRPQEPVRRPEAWGSFPVARLAAPDDSQKLRRLNEQFSLVNILKTVKERK